MIPSTLRKIEADVRRREGNGSFNIYSHYKENILSVCAKSGNEALEFYKGNYEIFVYGDVTVCNKVIEFNAFTHNIL